MKYAVFAIAAWLAALSAFPAPAAADVGEVEAIHIVSRVADEGIASDAPKRATKDEGVKLYAVVEAKTAGKAVYYTDAGPRIRLGGRTRAALPIDRAPQAIMLWFQVEPTTETMSNTESGKFRFEKIEYGEVALLSSIGRDSLWADVRPILTTDRGDGTGTNRFKVVALTHSGVISSPGTEARRGRGSGGLRDTVHRVSLRADDTYLGYLSEMNGQPYIWASAGVADKRHQAERLEGADCADFIVYGRRRQGKRVPYTWTGGLPDHTRLLARGTPGDDGRYRDKKGNTIPFPNVGDLVLFPRHVGALVEDRGHIGVLDSADVMVHHYFASPQKQAIGESDYGRTWIEVRRWK